MAKKNNNQAVAAIFSLLNDFRLSQGKQSLGFINPLIYSDSFRSAFNDIDSGSNPGCGTDGKIALSGMFWRLLTFVFHFRRVSRNHRMGPGQYSSRCSL